MVSSKIRIFSLTLLIALVMVGGGIYLYTNQDTSPVIDTEKIATSTVSVNTYVVPTVTSDFISALNWKTYRNEEYGFAVDYPSDFIVDEKHTYERIEKKALIGVAFRVSQRFLTNTNLSSDSYIAIERSDTGGESCDASNFLSSNTSYEFRKVNNVDYTYSKVSEGAAGNFYEDTVYAQNIRKSTCLIARLFTHSLNIGALGGRDSIIRAYDRVALEKLFQDIIASIEIIQLPDVPTIEKIVPSKGPVGITIDIIGYNLAGFEGDLDAWIENVKGEKAYVSSGGGFYPENYFEVYPGKEFIRVKIDRQLCKANHSYSGKVCSEFLTITPGVYKIYTAPWGTISNKVDFEITN